MALKDFAFNVLNKDKYARHGLIQTHRGNIKTPAFMPVGTQATVKACTINDIIKTGSEIILGNTYHLMIRPGVDRIQKAGGLHKFMNCDLPILTDSGGFQVMSLSKLNKIDREKGAIFNSHVDGKKFYLSPEESIRIQLGLNSDIVMIMDECPKNTDDYQLIQKSMELSLYWAKRSKTAFGKNPHKAIFGIIQGGLFDDLRSESLKGLLKMDFLGLKTLTLIKDTIKIIKAMSGKSIDIDEIPLEDETTYELFQKGETVGIFQYESPGMQKHLKSLRPTAFSDLIAIHSVYLSINFCTNFPG